MRLKADCVARGASPHAPDEQLLPNAPFTGAIVADRRDGALADDLYFTMFDNRNGTRDSTNTDVFFFKSLNGGSTWIGPTRVNNDASTPAPANRELRPRRPQPGLSRSAPNTGNDQFWPWIDVNDKGHINIALNDRRLDTDSVAIEWPTSRARPGQLPRLDVGCAMHGPPRGHGRRVRRCRRCGGDPADRAGQSIRPPYPGAGSPRRSATGTTSASRTCRRTSTTASAPCIFCGDYTQLAVADADNTVWGLYTDARNGRSSRTQAGRNPACEQADVFLDRWNSQSGGSAGKAANTDELFLVTPCPTDIQDKGAKSP